MYDVIGIGSAVYDIQMRIENFPREDTKIQATETRTISGGPCATALVAMSKLGIGVQYMGTMGNDSFGLNMLEDFKNYSVGTEHVRIVEDCESFHAVVLINPSNASRTCIWNCGTVPAPTQEDIDLNELRKAKYLYLDGHHHEAALYAAKEAKRNGVTVVMDAGGLYPGIDELVNVTDVLIPSEEFVLASTGCKTIEDAALALYRQYRPKVLVVTQGKQGGMILDGNVTMRYPAFAVDAVDTNGAGDVFHGAFVAGMFKGMAIYDCAVFASAVSALKCTQFGSREAIPSYKQVQAFLKDRGETIKVDD
jgi:sugar/nucleoside kinase (ribokinase family)